MARSTLSEKLVEQLRTQKAQEEVYDTDHVLGGSFGVRVSRSGRKVFFLVLPAELHRKRMTLGVYPLLSLSEARHKAAALLRAKLRGGEADLPPRTVGDLAEHFIERTVAGKSVSTRREYRRLLDVELLPLWRMRPLTEIKPADVFHLLDRVATVRGKPVLAERLRSLLSGLFKLAVERHLIEENPVKATEPLHRPNPPERTLTASQLERLWRGLDGEPANVRVLFKLLLLTGQRVNDVLAMQWGDLVLDEWQLSARGLRIPLSRQALALLKELRASSTSALVFPGRGGAGQKEVRKVAKRLNRQFGEKGEIEWTSREIRRTVEAGMRSLRIRPDVIEQALGRQTASPRQAKKRTEYDYREDLRLAFAAWDKKLSEFSEPAPSPAPQEPRGEQRPLSSKVVPLFPRR